ncbi:aminotransferase class I/II-fold pyridoxal phosphate-dependent enzyme [Fructilactobacillus cliffordii]|uniref:aminotransferase class I/II-fold pyridoxal phosphate-dependent enzyme n=1 Tax=Fructilactobacillus cliffordii TaxID=2940299 RepID=UPI002093DABC|nr:aminotransferase class I/II-fold pyridoxal phosphate-dependent enzyme [Fructilactobacillus cliffordii]USS86343.1 aminotransferase class I/II-fold pyridoxal phosphate-dependent enzyme [Fructilactobacillus cliffordii]
MPNPLVNHMNHEMLELSPSAILKFNDDVSQISNLIPLTLGEPDFPTPEHVKQAAIASINNDESHYAPTRGTAALRQAASDFLHQRYGLNYDPETEIIMTAGATGGIYAALTSILNPGDDVLIPTPIFPLYIPVTQLRGAYPVFMDTSKTGFVLKPEQLEETLAAHPNTKAIVLNFPSNPTGKTYDRAALEKLAKIIKQHNIFVISDEIYSELTYSGPHVSIANLLPAQTILLNGVSKSHAMTGWRIGIMAAPKDITDQLEKIDQFTITSTTTNAQAAATEALQNGAADTAAMKAEYERRRNFIVPALQDMGFKLANPDGAFYIFAKIPADQIQDSFEFSYDLARKGKVAVVPGKAFGPGGEGYVRISYATSMDNLQAAMQRIQEYLNRNE